MFVGTTYLLTECSYMLVKMSYLLIEEEEKKIGQTGSRPEFSFNHDFLGTMMTKNVRSILQYFSSS